MNDRKPHFTGTGEPNPPTFPEAREPKDPQTASGDVEAVATKGRTAVSGDEDGYSVTEREPVTVFFDFLDSVRRMSPFQMIERGIHLFVLRERSEFARIAAAGPPEFRDNARSEEHSNIYADDPAAIEFLGSQARWGYKDFDQVLDDRRHLNFHEQRDRFLELAAEGMTEDQPPTPDCARRRSRF